MAARDKNNKTLQPEDVVLYEGFEWVIEQINDIDGTTMVLMNPGEGNPESGWTEAGDFEVELKI